MNLRDLGSSFFVIGPHGSVPTDQIAGSHGVMFSCPKCTAEKIPFYDDGRAHSVVIYFCNPLGVTPYVGERGWYMQGVGLDDLTLSPSIALKPCDWHGFVTLGAAS